MLSLETRAAEAQGAQAAQILAQDNVLSDGVRTFNSITSGLRCMLSSLGNLEHSLTGAEPHVSIINYDSLSNLVRDIFGSLYCEGMLEDVREAVKDLRLRDELVELRTEVRAAFSRVILLVEKRLGDTEKMALARGRITDARWFTEKFVDAVLS